MSVSCPITRAPPAGVHKRLQYLHRGVNLITVCVTLSAALMGNEVVCQPLWIEDEPIQPGVNILSGPFDMSQISIHVAPDTNRSKSELWATLDAWLVKHHIPCMLEKHQNYVEFLGMSRTAQR